MDYRPFSTKKIRKIYVPVKEYPDYNFIGLILGPRGFTQRQMEQETGAKISLRGKGSVRDGRGRSATKDNNEDDDLHVVISADTEEALDHAEALVRRLLVPVEEGKNDIKRKQLRKLAELNGTLKDNNYGFEREQREGRAGGGNHAGNNIQCRWCGETSHPSSDCTFRSGRGGPGGPGGPAGPGAHGGPGGPRAASGPKVVTKEYYDLMSSLGEDVSGMVVQGDEQGNKEEGFSAFLASVGVDSSQQQHQQPQQHHGHHNNHQGHHGGPPPHFYGDGDRHGPGGGGQPFNRYPPPQGSTDDVPPWERDDFEGSSRPSNFPPPSSSSADAPAPWDM